MMRHVVIAALILGAMPAVASARSKGPTLRDRQQAACYGDVQRLCGSAMPDVNKVTACMKDKRPLVSKKCSDLWDVKS